MLLGVFVDSTEVVYVYTPVWKVGQGRVALVQLKYLQMGIKLNVTHCLGKKGGVGFLLSFYHLSLP